VIGRWLAGHLALYPTNQLQLPQMPEENSIETLQRTEQAFERAKCPLCRHLHVWKFPSKVSEYNKLTTPLRDSTAID